MQLDGFTSVSEILGPGIYALIRRGVVIYIGKSKSLYQRIYAHRTTASRAARGKSIPTWLPAKGFVFDEVWVRPCRLEDLDRLEAEMIAKYRPKFNQSLKSGARVKAPSMVMVGGVPVQLRREPDSVRRI